MNFSKISLIAKGWSSYNWLVKDEEGRQLLLKEVREKSPRKDLAKREGEMLKLANTAGVGPKLVEVNYENNYVLREYIQGERLLDWIFSEEFEKNVSREEFWGFLKELYKQLLALDSIGLCHNQLQVGKNILVSKKVSGGKTQYLPTIIDFEKASIKENKRTKNIGQIESFLFYNPHSKIAEKVREKMNLKL